MKRPSRSRRSLVPTENARVPGSGPPGLPLTHRFARRHFLQRAGALAALGLGGALDMIPAASAQGASDYKALVCVFLFGGNDGNNTVVPLDGVGYAQYAAVRSAASGLQLAQGQLLPIAPANAAVPYGLHPSLPELQTLFAQRKLAILANVGTLVQPTTKTQYQAKQVPLSLYSHSDQQAQWQSSISNQVAGTGWGGRLADMMAAFNADSGFPVVTSLGGSVLFTTGKVSSPLSIPVSGSFALAGYGNGPASDARLAALNKFLAAESGNAFVNAANAIGSKAIRLSATMNPILANASSAVAPIFAALPASNSTGKALYQVAKTIEARATTGAKRQIFFIGQGNYDTHANQAPTQANLLAELSPALKAFYDATVALGVASQVTTFTLVGLRSDVPAGFRRRHRPCVGQSSLHHRRRGEGRRHVRRVPDARTRRPERCRESRSVDPDDRGRPVRCDACALVRRACIRSRGGISEPALIRDERRGLHGVMGSARRAGGSVGARLLASAAFAMSGALAGTAVAQSATAGKALYKTYCQVCHTPDPSTSVAPFNQIMNAADNPAQIAVAASADPSQMGFITTTMTAANLQDLAAYVGTFAKTAPVAQIDIVEFYNADRDHYFLSGAAAEIADLDAGVHPGWTRTGLAFRGYASQAGGASPVCRFYIPPVNGDSHFYSASVAECADVRARFPGFTYEAPDVFYIALPDLATGACAAGTVPVYRVWNNRSDTNHRYTTSEVVRQQMLSAGWIAEGYGPDQVIMCAPTPE